MRIATTANRLNYVMNLRGLKQVDILKIAKPLCRKYNIRLGSNDLSQYVTGKVEPSQRKLSLLAEILNTNEVWLMGYDVPMERNENQNRGYDPINEIMTISRSITDLDILNTYEKELIVAVINNAISRYNITKKT